MVISLRLPSLYVPCGCARVNEKKNCGRLEDPEQEHPRFYRRSSYRGFERGRNSTGSLEADRLEALNPFAGVGE